MTVLNAILSLLFLLACFVVAFNGFSMPVSSWEEMGFPLASVAQWVQDQSLSLLEMPLFLENIPDTASKAFPQVLELIQSVGIGYNSKPMNGELFALWNVLFFQKDTLIHLYQFPFLFIFLLAIFSIARKLYIPTSIALTTSLAFCFSPLLLFQASAASTDLIFATLVLVCVNFITGLLATHNVRYGYATILTASLLPGIRFFGVILFVFFVCIFFLHQWIRSHFHDGLRHFLTIIFSSLGTAFLISGYWYIRNFIQFQNPFFPFHISIGNFYLFQGIASIKDLVLTYHVPNLYIDSPHLANLFYSWSEKETQYSLTSQKAGLGSLWFILGIPFTLMVTLKTILKNQKIALFALFLFYFLLFIQPSAWWPKNTLFLLALGAISTAYMLQHGTFWFRQIIGVVMLGLTLYTCFATFAFTSLKSYVYVGRNYASDNRSIANTFFQEYTFADTIPKGTSIAHSPNLSPYPLYAKHFKNEVSLVDAPDATQFAKKLINSPFDYVVVPNHSMYNHWIALTPTVFELHYSGDMLRVFKINR